MDQCSCSPPKQTGGPDSEGMFTWTVKCQNKTEHETGEFFVVAKTKAEAKQKALDTCTGSSETDEKKRRKKVAKNKTKAKASKKKATKKKTKKA